MLQIGILGQSLSGVEQFAATDAGSPDTYVIRILQFGEVGEESVFVQIVNFFLAGQFLIASQCDNLHTRSHHEEGHIETNLVVACTSRSVGDSIGTDLLGITGDGDGLEDTLAADGDGVAVVAEHIAENHIFQRLLIILMGHIECDILHSTQLIGVLFVLLQLFLAEAASIGACCVNVPAVLGQLHNGVGGVKTS